MYKTQTKVRNIQLQPTARECFIQDNNQDHIRLPVAIGSAAKLAPVYSTKDLEVESDKLGETLCLGTERDNPTTASDIDGRIHIPLDILLSDKFSALAKSYYSGVFEELVLNDNGELVSSGVYTRGMKNYEKNEKRQFTGKNNNAIAIALFKDENDEIRFFCNHYCEHIGIQPGMGLPVFAGTIRYKGGKYVIDNNSGHYKPSFDIDVLGFIQSMNPKANVYERFCYQPELGSKGNAEFTRIHDITGPEDYADLAREIRGGSRRDLYNYLKEHGYWDLIFSDSTVDKSLAWAREQIIEDLREEKLKDVERRSQGTQTDERSFTHWASSKDDSNKALWDGPKRGHFHKTYKEFSPAI